MNNQPAHSPRKTLRSQMIPESVLKPDAIYSGDNGRLICRECAGMSAKFSGRDLSGHKVTSMPRIETLYWQTAFGVPMSCEGQCTTYQVPPPATLLFAVVLGAGLKKGGCEAVIYGVGEDDHLAWRDAMRTTRIRRDTLERNHFFPALINLRTCQDFQARGSITITVDDPVEGETARQVSFVVIAGSVETAVGVGHTVASAWESVSDLVGTRADLEARGYRASPIDAATYVGICGLGRVPRSRS